MGHKVIKLCPPKERAGQREAREAKEAKEAVRSADGLSDCQKTSVEMNLIKLGRGSSRGQPPASNGIKCPGSLAVQGFRQAKRGLLRRSAAQK